MSAYPFTRAYLAVLTQLFLWSVGQCFDTLTDMRRMCCHDFYLFIFFCLFPSWQLYFLSDIMVTENTAAPQFQREAVKSAPGGLSPVLSPHQHILLNLHKHTHTCRTCTQTYLTLLMVYWEHNQSLPWISTPALCCRRGEENGEFTQS